MPAGVYYRERGLPAFGSDGELRRLVDAKDALYFADFEEARAPVETPFTLFGAVSTAAPRPALRCDAFARRRWIGCRSSRRR